MSRLKVWRFKSELIEMSELKANDFFQFEKDNEKWNMKSSDLFMAGEDAEVLTPDQPDGATASVQCHKLIFCPEWGKK